MDTALRLAVEGHTVELNTTLDGRASSWRFDGEELLGGPSADPFEHGMYAMGPWAGRLDGNALRVGDGVMAMPPTYREWALHGTVVGRTCRVVAHEQAAAHASAIIDIDLGPTWPWPGTLRAHWHVEADLLRTRLELIAHDEAFPGVIGWHPWFRRTLRGSSASWRVDGALLAERDDAYRLSGRLRVPDREQGTYDDAFRGTGSAILRWPGVISLETHSSAPWFVVFDMRPEAVCLEPQSGPPNGVNDGLGDPIARARPGHPVVLETVWRLSRESPRG